MKLLGVVLLTLFGLTGLAALAGFLLLRGSRPDLEGREQLQGLSAPVVVERDDLGVATLTGQTQLDLSRALGFVHAQERFFQMDLQRRLAAGELAALLGTAALPADRAARRHRFRQRAQDIVARLPADDQALIQAYAEGVNAGLAQLRTWPFEYWLLRIEPNDWLPEDVALTAFSMYFSLQDQNCTMESVRGVLNSVFPEPVVRFLSPDGTQYDAPLQGPELATPEIPPPQVHDFRQRSGTSAPASSGSPRSPSRGSNNAALAAGLTAHAGAILENDMHLQLQVPNIWYRVALVVTGSEGAARKVTGVTLPGVPAVIAGSNGDVAWGWTNSSGDWCDLVVLEDVPGQPELYQTADGPRELTSFEEVIHVKGGSAEVLTIPESIWGPVIDRDHRGRRRALRWVAHDPEAFNLDLARLASARTAEEALETAARAGMPQQNLLAVDRSGNIAWTISGPMPRRVGYDGRQPTSWADGSRGWNGWLTPNEHPRILNPSEGILWTANARVVDGPMLEKIGFGDYALGARAQRLRDGLRQLRRASEREVLGVVLDVRSPVIARWRELLLRVLASPAPDSSGPQWRELRQEVQASDSRAAVDSVGYLVVREFRAAVEQKVFDFLTSACREVDDQCQLGWLGGQTEGPLWRLVTEQPLHYLPPEFEDWSQLLQRSADEVRRSFVNAQGELDLPTWGEHNRARIRHPLSSAIPGLGLLVDMPEQSLPGDMFVPRVQWPDLGASERMVVSPGREDQGLFHMPGGQSGHPLAPYFGAGHEAWVRGEATPFLPGPTRYRLRLEP